jgi:Tetratricopeptide repeat
VKPRAEADRDWVESLLAAAPAEETDLPPAPPRTESPPAAAGLPPPLPPSVALEVPPVEGAEPPKAAAARPPRPAPPAPPPDARPSPTPTLANVRPAEVPPAMPFSSPTLAELYFQQGLLERAVEVYRQLVQEEPGNDRARRRLAEVEALVAAAASDLPVPAGGEGDERAARRHVLERTIELLEGLLAVVRRR